jgi:hypothetical protein
MPSDEELLRRLEDAAPLLEATLTRYRALVPALKAWGWKQRLRAVADVAREVARTDQQVEQALQRAHRRAEAESWPDGEARELLENVSALRAQLENAISHRLESEATPATGLPALLELVINVPRKVALGERDAAAHEALSTDLELIPTLERFGTAVEHLFSRPLARARRLPFTLAEYDSLLALWPEGSNALAKAWVLVERIDTTGGVERELSKRARRAPRGARGLAGPRALVHATFWSNTAAIHQKTVIDERFAPLQLSDAEHRAALRFLLAREVDGGAKLESDGPRAALLMLAHELTASPEGRAPLVGGRARVGAWAQAADALHGDEDWRRLRDGLRQLAGRSVGLSLPPLYRVGKRPERPARPSLERLTDFFSPGE